MALARRRHSPDEAKFADERAKTWLSQADRDAVTLAFLEGGYDALTELVDVGTSLRSSTLPAGQRESFVLDVLAGDTRRAAICRWADERRIPFHEALARFEYPDLAGNGDIVATRAELRW